MARGLSRQLSASDIERYASSYLHDGRRQESWQIVHVEIDDDVLRARVRMSSLAISPTDAGGFHLTIFSALEFLSQLVIIYMHAWVGLDEKTRECWMLEAQIRSRNVIRDPENIEVVMHVDRIRNIHGKVLIDTRSGVSDGTGRFDVALTGFMS